jgi:hypothetical protein
MSHEEYATLSQVTAALNRLDDKIEAQNREYTERRRVDDEREKEAKARDKEILARADDHGGRLKTLEVNWMTFFGDNGAFTFVKNQLKDQGAQNKWLIGLAFTTLIAIIVDLVRHH